MSGDPFWDVYTEKFYSDHASEPHFSQTKLVGRAIAQVLTPARVVDLGCGVGAMLSGVVEWTRETHGVTPTCVGIEAPTAIQRMARAGAMRIPREWYFPADLREQTAAELLSALLEQGRYDVAVSAEVAEHLPPEAGGWHVDMLCSLSDTVVFSAAYPGQGGDQHISERPWTYWREKFSVRGYGYDEVLTVSLVDLFREQTTRAWGYAKNMRVYKREVK